MHTAKLSTGANGAVVVSSSPLGRGGEGSVFTVSSIDLPGFDADDLVAKIYHEPATENREAKIAAMLASPPKSDSVAWPLASLYEGAAFAGYIMKKLPSETYRSWSDLSDVKSRRKVAPKFDARYAIVASENLGIAIKSIHDAGHCVGDVNESNILVSADSRIMIVDTDSAQISTGDGKIFPCTVGKQEYTSPELTHGSFRDNLRSVESDVFAYGVAVFQMLTGGAHPTDAKFTGTDDPPSMVNKIRQGIYPGLTATPSSFQTIARIPVAAIPTVYKNVIRKSLSHDASDRPALDAILKAEAGCRGHLVQCDTVEAHWYDSREKGCPWCANAAKPGAIDPWGDGAPKRAQSALPALSFNDDDDAPVIRRAPVSTASSRAQSPQAGMSNPGQQATPQVAGPPASGVSAGFPSGFGASQNSAGSGQSPAMQQHPQPQAPPEPPQKNKIRGKTVLTYADGSRRVRPPLAILFRSNPKLAISCFFDELPGFSKFWWPNSRPVAAWWASVIGVILGLALALAWLLLVPAIQGMVPSWEENETARALLASSAIIAAVTASLGVVFLFFSALGDLVKSKKSLQPGYKLKFHNPALVILQFLTVAIATGPLLIVAIICLAAVIALKIFFAILEGIFSPQNSRSRR